jgi:hypothetical protein
MLEYWKNNAPTMMRPMLLTTPLTIDAWIEPSRDSRTKSGARKLY